MENETKKYGYPSWLTKNTYLKGTQPFLSTTKGEIVLFQFDAKERRQI